MQSNNITANRDLLIEDINRVNNGFMKLQNIDIHVKYLVYGYLREQQQILFSREYKYNQYFDTYSMAVVIIVYITNKPNKLLPINLHITTIRPGECDISWLPPIELNMNQYKLGYNIQVFKEEKHD
eukprot:509238_1